MPSRILVETAQARADLRATCPQSSSQRANRLDLGLCADSMLLVQVSNAVRWKIDAPLSLTKSQDKGAVAQPHGSRIAIVGPSNQAQLVSCILKQGHNVEHFICRSGVPAQRHHQ